MRLRPGGYGRGGAGALWEEAAELSGTFRHPPTLGGDRRMAPSTATASSSSYALRFDAGRVCLDLPATTHPTERFDSVPVLRAWISGAGLVPPGTPLAHVDASWLPPLRELRDAIALLTRGALPTGSSPSPSPPPSPSPSSPPAPPPPPPPPASPSPADDLALARVNAAAHAAPPAPRAVRADDGTLVRELDRLPDRAALLSLVARDAVDLLTDPAARACLRRCAGDDCPIVYLDTSRGHLRRWCSGDICGNRERVARHRRRTGAGARPESRR